MDQAISREPTADSTPNPKQPQGNRSPIIAVVLALIPGLGHFYAGARTRGVALITLIPTLILLILWRLDKVGVDVIEAMGGAGLGELTHAGQSALGTAIVLTVLLILVYLWNFWDAYSTAAGHQLPGLVPYAFLFIVAFVIGWDVTEINLGKAITEVGDIVPRLSQLAWPWDQAFVQGEEITEANAQWNTPCGDDAPNPPEEIPGQPYIRIEPTCGEISGPGSS